MTEQHNGAGAKPSAAGRGARVVLTTFGSFGDLHPYIAIALALRARGHRVTLATIATYRPKVEALGLDFHPLRPDLQPEPDLVRRIMDLRRGPEVILREIFLPALRDTYEDLAPVVRGALRLRLDTDEHWADLRGPTACELVDPAEKSGLHARLTRVGAGWQVEDLGSTKGTRLDGEPLLPHQPRSITPGAQIALGPITLVFEGVAP